jgi:hypothetical protein
MSTRISPDFIAAIQSKPDGPNEVLFEDDSIIVRRQNKIVMIEGKPINPVFIYPEDLED